MTTTPMEPTAVVNGFIISPVAKLFGGSVALESHEVQRFVLFTDGYLLGHCRDPGNS
jgi:hypothetical protein